MPEGSSTLSSSLADGSPEQLTAVLYDQLDYLICHKHGDIEDLMPCPECTRLREVLQVLLRPFMTAGNRSMGKAA
jgi:hypothetical protein